MEAFCRLFEKNSVSTPENRGLGAWRLVAERVESLRVEPVLRRS